MKGLNLNKDVTHREHSPPLQLFLLGENHLWFMTSQLRTEEVAVISSMIIPFQCELAEIPEPSFQVTPLRHQRDPWQELNRGKKHFHCICHFSASTKKDKSTTSQLSSLIIGSIMGSVSIMLAKLTDEKKIQVKKIPASRQTIVEQEQEKQGTGAKSPTTPPSKMGQ